MRVLMQFVSFVGLALTFVPHWRTCRLEGEASP